MSVYTTAILSEKLNKKARKLLQQRKNTQTDDESQKKVARVRPVGIAEIITWKQKLGGKLESHRDSMYLHQKTSKSRGEKKEAPTQFTFVNGKLSSFKNVAQTKRLAGELAKKAKNYENDHNLANKTNPSVERDRVASETQVTRTSSVPSRKANLKRMIRSVQPLAEEVRRYKNLSKGNHELPNDPRAKMAIEQRNAVLLKAKAIAVAREKARILRHSHKKKASNSVHGYKARVSSFKSTSVLTKTAIQAFKCDAVKRENELKSIRVRQHGTENHRQPKQTVTPVSRGIGSKPFSTDAIVSRSEVHASFSDRFTALAGEELIDVTDRKGSKRQQRTLAVWSKFLEAFTECFSDVALRSKASEVAFVEDLLEVISHLFENALLVCGAQISLDPDWILKLRKCGKRTEDGVVVTREEYLQWVETLYQNLAKVTTSPGNEDSLHCVATPIEENIPYDNGSTDTNVNTKIFRKNSSSLSKDFSPSKSTLNTNNSSGERIFPISDWPKGGSEDSTTAETMRNSATGRTNTSSPIFPKREVKRKEKEIKLNEVTRELYAGRKWLYCIQQNDDWIQGIAGATQWSVRPELCSALTVQSEKTGDVTVSARLVRWDTQLKCKIPKQNTTGFSSWIMDGRMNEEWVEWVVGRLCVVLQHVPIDDFDGYPDAQLIFQDPSNPNTLELPNRLLPSPPEDDPEIDESQGVNITTPKETTSFTSITQAEENKLHQPNCRVAFRHFQKFLQNKREDENVLQPHLLFRAIDARDTGYVSRMQLMLWCQTLWLGATEEDIKSFIEAVFSLSDSHEQPDHLFYLSVLWDLFDVEERFMKPLISALPTAPSHTETFYALPSQWQMGKATNTGSSSHKVRDVLRGKFEDRDVGCTGSIDGKAFSSIMFEISPIVRLCKWERWTLYSKFAVDDNTGANLADKFGFRYTEFLAYLDRFEF